MRTSWIVSSGICEHRIAFLPLDENGQKSTTEQWEAHMVRRTARPFHRNLTELGGGSGNKRLHEAFGWAESTYCFSPVCSSLVTGRCAKGSMNECCGCQLGWLRRRLASTAFKAITTSLKVR